MSNNWNWVELGKLINFRRGYDLPKEKMVDGKYPVVASNGIIGYHNQFTNKAPVITIGRSGNVGTPYYYNSNCWAHNTTLVVDAFYDCYPKYIFYLLKTLNLKNYRGGSAVPTLNRNHIHPIKVYIPKMFSDQKAIADVLSSFDDKIELNNKIIKNLEEQTQSLYKHWFIDFEFPNENGKPYKSSGGKFKQSELGLIPEDWNCLQIYDVCKRITKKVGKNKYEVLSAINSGELIPSKEYFDKQVFSQNIEKYICVEPNCFAYNPARANIGSIGMNKFNYIGCVSPVYVVVKFEDPYEWYWEYTIKSESFRDIIKLRSSGSVRQNFDFNSFSSVQIKYPNKETILNFNDEIIKRNKLIEQIKIETQKLIETRDYLLPKLISGKIKVSDVQ